MSLRVLILAAMITAFAPLSLDLYLPALPELRTELGASEPQARFTLTACIIGLALGQLLVSMIPERFGRRPPLIIGIAFWVLMTLACAFAPTIWAVMAIRLGQGIGAGVAVALARAVVADLDRANLSTHLSRMMLVLSVVPILAPALGGLAMNFTDWRGLFIGLALTGMVLLFLVATILKESYRPQATRPRSNPLFPMYALMRSRAFLLPALISGASFGVMFAYIGESPFLFRDHFGMEPLPYGLLFGFNATALIVGFQIGPRLERRWGSRASLQAGSAIGAVGATTMFISSIVAPNLAIPVVISLMLVLCGAGILNPVSTAVAIDSHPLEVGAASGVSGALQFFMGGIIGTIPSLLLTNDGAAALALVTLTCLVFSWLGATRLPERVDTNVGREDVSQLRVAP